jgi:hypothetical protein
MLVIQWQNLRRILVIWLDIISALPFASITLMASPTGSQIASYEFFSITLSPKFRMFAG